MTEQIIKNVSEDQDSLEIGTTGKGGKVKVYGDFRKKEEFKSRVDNAIECMLYAQEQITKKSSV